MKKILCLLILSNILSSCNNTDLQKFDINLDIKSKKISQLMKGSQYYKINGLKFKDSIQDIIIKKPNSFLKFELKKGFINGYKKFWFTLKEIPILLHDYIDVNNYNTKIKFNKYLKTSGYILPFFNKENIELLGCRSSKMLRFIDDEVLEIEFSEDSYLLDNKIFKKDLKFYKSSIDNLLFLKENGLYPIDYNAILALHNPLSNYYTLLPDLDRFSENENNIINKLIADVNTINNSKSKLKKHITISDTVIDKSLTYDNCNIKIIKGSNIEFKNNASLIIKNSLVNILGNKENNVLLSGKGMNSIFFINCDSINIDYAKFESFSNFKNDSIILPSAITFYNSNVLIKNSVFKNNIEGDDYINLFNSNFAFNNITLENAKSDAIDSDFSNGSITNSDFHNVGNDAIDCSGSNVKLENLNLDKIFDKAVSAGENTNIKIVNSSISNSELGIVCKDGSVIEYENIDFINNKIDFSVFYKKDFYKSPKLIGDIIEQEQTYLFQKKTDIKINQINQDLKYIDNVEDLLYGKIYGKSSK